MKECMATKICPICEIEKEDSEFSKKRNGLQWKCKSCQREYSRQHYKNNKPDYKEKHKIRVAETKAWFVEYKSTLFCIICGENFPNCLDFHHIDEDTKEHDIALLVSQKHSVNKIKREIEKCVVLCSNCHRKVHAGFISLENI